MKKLKLLLCFSLFIFSFSFSYGQSWIWGGAGIGTLKPEVTGSSVATDKVGNVYSTGTYNTTVIFGSYTRNCNNWDAYLVRYNYRGDVVWLSAPTGSTNHVSWGNSVATDGQGNIYLTGCFTDTITFGTITLISLVPSFNREGTFYLVKYDSSGNVLWARESVNASGTTQGSGLATDKSGYIYATGYFQNNASFGTHNLVATFGGGWSAFFLAKYDPNGNVIWATGESGAAQCYGNSVVADEIGDIYTSGYLNGTGAIFGPYTLNATSLSEDGFIAKFDSSGNVKWAYAAVNPNTTSEAMATGITADNSGNAYLSGWFTDGIGFGPYNLTTPSGYSLFFTKYNSNGSVVWVKQVTGNNNSSWAGYSLCADASNHIYFAGVGSGDTMKYGSFSLTTPSAGYLAFLMKLDTSGHALCGSVLANGTWEVVWTFGVGEGVATDPSGFYTYAGGTTGGTIICGSDTIANTQVPYVARWLNCDGELQGINKLKPNNEKLIVYPNPFTNTTTISIIHNSPFTIHNYLELDDLTGRKLRWIEFTGAQYQLQAQDLAKGIYFIRAFDSDMNVIGTSKIIIQ